MNVWTYYHEVLDLEVVDLNGALCMFIEKSRQSNLLIPDKIGKILCLSSHEIASKLVAGKQKSWKGLLDQDSGWDSGNIWKKSDEKNGEG